MKNEFGFARRDNILSWVANNLVLRFASKNYRKALHSIYNTGLDTLQKDAQKALRDLEKEIMTIQPDPDLVRAPWNPEQVRSCNEFQNSGIFHPFTCGKCIRNKTITGILIATENGWICETCDYTQNWAHLWMTNFAWLEAADRYNALAAKLGIKS